MPKGITEDNQTQDVRARVRELVRALAPRPVESVDSSARLEADLLFDSLTLVELAVRLEQEFSLPDFEEQAMDLEIETVGDVESFVENLIGGARA